MEKISWVYGLLFYFIPSCYAASWTEAIKNDDTTAVNWLLANNKTAFINDVNEKGYSPLIWAAECNHTQLCKRLIVEGADVNKRNYINWTALHLSAYNGNRDLSRLLMKAGADIHVFDDEGNTPLSIAVMFNYTEITQILLSTPKRIPVLEYLILLIAGLLPLVWLIRKPLAYYCIGCRSLVACHLGLTCKRCPTFTCDICFKNQAMSQINLENFGYFKRRKGKIICVNPNCSYPVDDKELIEHWDEDTYNLYCEARNKVIGQIEVEKQLPEEKKRWETENKTEVDRHYHHIVDTILTLCCPCCGTPFIINPEDCLALCCSLCVQNFCGWCIEICGNSAQAHEHVRNCTGGKLNLTKAEIDEEHSKKKIIKLQNYLKQEIRNEEIRMKLVDAIIPLLSESEKEALEIRSSANKVEDQIEPFFNIDTFQLKFEMTEVNLVGNGSFGKVYHGEFPGNQLCVVENLVDLTPETVEDLEKSYDDLKKVIYSNHVNLHKVIGVNLRECLMISMPFDTSLFNFMYINSSVNSITLSSILKLSIIKDIVCAIEYLHANGVIHGDIRPENILLVFSEVKPVSVTAQVTGFGFTRSLRHLNQPHNSDASSSAPLPFSLRYKAPELLENYPTRTTLCTTPTDIYALGSMLNEIMTERIPWPELTTIDELIKAVMNGKRPLLFYDSAMTDSEKRLGDVIGNANKGCLSGNATNRPTASALMSEINNVKDIVKEIIISDKIDGRLIDPAVFEGVATDYSIEGLPKIKSETRQRPSATRGYKCGAISAVRNVGHKYETCGIFSAGLDGKLDVENDLKLIRDYSNQYNRFGGAISFYGNSGSKECIIGNLISRFLPSAQSSNSDLVVSIGGHGKRRSGDFEVVSGGAVLKEFTDTKGVPVVPMIYHHFDEVVTFTDFMDAVKNFNDAFNSRVTVHIVLFLCYASWIKKLKEAREKSTAAFPDIGIIISAADILESCEDTLFANAFWRKDFGQDDSILVRAMASKPQKYISLLNSPVSEMTKEDFETFWFQNGSSWKRSVDASGDTTTISGGEATCLGDSLLVEGNGVTESKESEDI